VAYTLKDNNDKFRVFIITWRLSVSVHYLITIKFGFYCRVGDEGVLLQLQEGAGL
jgi:hypothetical protein